ncbi:Adenylate cyclase 1 [Pelomyxa schiedti]|nr:Adenylate cyclase 1 [Pelomyxa schiedti]
MSRNKIYPVVSDVGVESATAAGSTSTAVAVPPILQFWQRSAPTSKNHTPSQTPKSSSTLWTSSGGSTHRANAEIMARSRRRRATAPLCVVFVSLMAICGLIIAAIAIGPFLAAWISTTQTTHDIALASVESAAEKARSVLVDSSTTYIKSYLGTAPSTLKLLKTNCNQSFFEDTPNWTNVLPELHACFRPISISFPIINDLVFAWQNEYGQHSMHNKAGSWAVWDCTPNTSNIGVTNTFYYYNGMTPTYTPFTKIDNYTLAARDFWKVGYIAGRNNVWLAPFFASTQGFFLSYWVEQVYHLQTGKLIGIAASSISLKQMAETFKSFPVTDNGAAFLLNVDLLTIAATPGFVVWNQTSRVLYSALNHPNKTIQETVSLWLNFTGGQQISFNWTYKETWYDVREVNPTNGTQKWWIIMLTPKADYIGDLLHKNSVVEQETGKITALVTCLTLFMVILTVALIAFLARYITRPLAEVSEKLYAISQMDFSDERLSSNQNFNGSMLREVHDLSTHANSMKVALNCFGKYVPHNIVQWLIRNQVEPHIGVRQGISTVMFLDISNFTNMMEVHGCEMMFSVLEALFEPFSSALATNFAVIDKFIGDAIMAFWNIPDPSPVSHELLACRSAEMILAALDRMNDVFKEKYGITVGLRIGIHSGPVYAGNVGSSTRMNFTVIGDTVNLAARLEPLGKELKATVLVSDAVRRSTSSEFSFRCLGFFRIKGFGEAVRVHEFIGRSETLPKTNEQLLLQYKPVDDLFMSRAYTEGFIAKSVSRTPLLAEHHPEALPEILQEYLRNAPEDEVAREASKIMVFL